MERNIAALLREDARTVHVSFEQNPSLDAAEKTYTYITHLPVSEGDLAVANVSGHYKVVRVMKVDGDVCLEPGDTIKYQWLRAVLDYTAWEANDLRNQSIEATVSEAYKNNLRRSFSQQILSGLTDDAKANVLKLTGGTTA